MKAMWAAFAAIVVIAGVAAVVLERVDTTTADRYAAPSARPPQPADRP